MPDIDFNPSPLPRPPHRASAAVSFSPAVTVKEIQAVEASPFSGHALDSQSLPQPIEFPYPEEAALKQRFSALQKEKQSGDSENGSPASTSDSTPVKQSFRQFRFGTNSIENSPDSQEVRAATAPDKTARRMSVFSARRQSKAPDRSIEYIREQLHRMTSFQQDEAITPRNISTAPAATEGNPRQPQAKPKKFEEQNETFTQNIKVAFKSTGNLADEARSASQLLDREAAELKKTFAHENNIRAKKTSNMLKTMLETLDLAIIKRGEFLDDLDGEDGMTRAVLERHEAKVRAHKFKDKKDLEVAYFANPDNVDSFSKLQRALTIPNIYIGTHKMKERCVIRAREEEAALAVARAERQMASEEEQEKAKQNLRNIRLQAQSQRPRNSRLPLPISVGRVDVQTVRDPRPRQSSHNFATRELKRHMNESDRRRKLCSGGASLFARYQKQQLDQQIQLEQELDRGVHAQAVSALLQKRKEERESSFSRLRLYSKIPQEKPPSSSQGSLGSARSSAADSGTFLTEVPVAQEEEQPKTLQRKSVPTLTIQIPLNDESSENSSAAPSGSQSARPRRRDSNDGLRPTPPAGWGNNSFSLFSPRRPMVRRSVTPIAPVSHDNRSSMNIFQLIKAAEDEVQGKYAQYLAQQGNPVVSENADTVIPGDGVNGPRINSSAQSSSSPLLAFAQVVEKKFHDKQTNATPRSFLPAMGLQELVAKYPQHQKRYCAKSRTRKLEFEGSKPYSVNGISPRLPKSPLARDSSQTLNSVADKVIEEMLQQSKVSKQSAEQIRGDQLDPVQKFILVVRYLEAQYMTIDGELLRTLEKMSSERASVYSNMFSHFWTYLIDTRHWNFMLRDLQHAIQDKLTKYYESELQIAKSFWLKDFVQSVHSDRDYSVEALQLMQKLQTDFIDGERQATPSAFFELVEDIPAKALLRLDMQSLICALAFSFGCNDVDLFKWMEERLVPFVVISPESSEYNRVYIISSTSNLLSQLQKLLTSLEQQDKDVLQKAKKPQEGILRRQGQRSVSQSPSRSPPRQRVSINL